MRVANKGTSKLLTAECIQKCSETIYVESGQQDFLSDTLLVDAKQVLEQEIHSVNNEHSMVQAEENSICTITETMEEYKSLAFSTSKETSEEMNLQFELLPEFAKVSTVLPPVHQRKLFREKRFYADDLLPEEGNKCYELDKFYIFVHQQQFALQDHWNEKVMNPRLCHVAKKDDKPMEGNTKCGRHTVIALFGKKTDFDFVVSFVEETFPSNTNVWNP